MKQLLIVYYSLTGGTEQMAQAAAKAACGEEGAETILMRAEDCQPDDMLAADGYIFAAPENLAAIAGVMKAFFDRCYYPLLGRIEGRPYARAQLERIATGWRLRKVIDTPIICTHAQSEEVILAEKVIDAADLEKCAEIGATLAAGLAMGVF